MSLNKILATTVPTNVLALSPIEQIEDMSELCAFAELELQELDAALCEAEGIEVKLQSFVATLEAAESADSIQAIKAVAQYDVLVAEYPSLCAAIEIPSMEGADDLDLNEVELACEGIKETAKKVGDAIVAIFKAMKNATVAFFKQYFTIIGRLEANIGKLEKLAKDIPASATPKKTDISFGSLPYLYIAGKQVTAKDIKSIYQGIGLVSKEVIKLLKDAEDAFDKDTNAAAGQIGIAWAKIQATLNKQGKELTVAEGRALVSGKFKEYSRSEMLPGNEAVILTMIFEGGWKMPSATLVTMPAQTAAPKTIAALTPSTLSGPLSDAREILNTTKALRANADQVISAADKLMAAFTKLNKADDKNKSMTGRAVMRFANKLISSYVKGYIKAASKNSVQFSNASMQLVKNSISNLDGKKPAKDKDAK